MKKLSKFYDRNKSGMMIRSRYRKCIPPIRLTLKRIVPTKEFQLLKENLRKLNWKDWHILMAIDNLVLNYRFNKLNLIQQFPSMEQFAREFLNKEEDEEDLVVPLEEFTEEKMEIALEFSMLATLKLFGFSLEGKSINGDELKSFLAEKFNYWNDDVEHNPIFDL